MIAPLHGGVPPTGVGVFARDQGVGFLSGWDWVALNAARADAVSKGRELVSRGVGVWLYSTPGRWVPSRWRGELARLLELVTQIPGCSGIIANPEAGWSGQGGQARELGRALKRAAEQTRVGLGSVPLWPQLASVASECRGSCWGMPELYGKRAWVDGSAERRASFWSRYTAAWGELRTIPAISGWFGSNGIVVDPSPDAFRAYLETIPRAMGACAWLTAGGPPSWSIPVLRGWEPAGLYPLRWLLAAAAWLTSPAGLVAAALVVVFLAASAVSASALA